MSKIIFFSKNLNIGGMEKALVALLNGLSSKYDITLVLEDKSGILLDDLLQNIIVKEYKMSKCRIVAIRKIHNFLKRVLWSLKNKNRYSFSCNYATYSVIGSRLAQIASKNNCYYIHSDYYEVYKNRDDIKNFFIPHRIENFKKIIFVSNESRYKLVGVMPEIEEKSFVINNLISYNDIMSLANEKSDDVIDSKHINLLFVGRLENESKNFVLLIEAFAKVYQKNKNYRLYILGDGRYKNSLITLIDKFNLKSSVFMLGEKKNPYVYMKDCDAIIFTSNYEGFPVTYLEALVLNKRILTTVMVSDESIDIRDYSIYLKRDAEDIADKILTNVTKQSDKTNDLDFDYINKKKLELIEEIIEV